MNILKIKSFNQLFQRAAAFLLSLVLAIGVSLSYAHAAQAAVDTTSAATKADAKNINQRKENAPHYPNWYEDQRSLESYMDNAGINPDLADRRATESDRGNLIERSREQLKDVADNVRDTLNPNTSDNYSRSDSVREYRSNSRSNNDPVVSTDDIPGRVENRLERVKDTFQQATERALEENDTLVTGTSNS